MIHIYYRISDGGYKKQKLEKATKEACLENFLSSWFGQGNQEDVFSIVYDNVCDENIAKYEKILDKFSPFMGYVIRTETHEGSSAQSFKTVYEFALEHSDDTQILFVEDDYIWQPTCRTVILEGLERADYVAPYCHPDKFIPASRGGNPLVGEDGGEVTKVFLTNSSFWMLTNSTTMTFASTVCTLREDERIIRSHIQHEYPTDYKMFLDLRTKGRTLIQPIPGQATHAETNWLSPLINWESLL